MGNDTEQFNKLMSAITSLDNKICDRIDRIEEQNNQIISDIKNLQANFKNLSESHEKLKVDLDKVNIEINYLKQSVLSSDVVITGVPYHQGEVLFDTVKVICKQYKVDICNTDYKSLYRLRSRNSTSIHSPICIELYSKTLRGAIMSQQKRCGPILLHMIDSTLPKVDKQKIYFKERLTPYNNELLIETKKFCAENQFKYVWFQNCDILVKKTETSKPTKIVVKSDLLKLKNNTD